MVFQAVFKSYVSENHLSLALEGWNFNHVLPTCQGDTGKNFSLLAQLKVVFRTCNFQVYFSLYLVTNNRKLENQKQKYRSRILQNNRARELKFLQRTPHISKRPSWKFQLSSSTGSLFSEAIHSIFRRGEIARPPRVRAQFIQYLSRFLSEEDIFCNVFP